MSYRRPGGAAGARDGEWLHPTVTERRIGTWSARAIVVLSAAYAITMAAGFVSIGNLREPLPDPYLAVVEVLILALAPLMVALVAAIQGSASRATRVWATMALGWMLAAAAVTMSVHVVELTVSRRLLPGSMPGQARLLDFQWPSVIYALDIAAWDLLCGLSFVCAAVVFRGHGGAGLARRGLVLSGVLCLAGLVGPAVGVLAWRAVGIAGYAVVFPVTCLALSRVFSSVRAADRREETAPGATPAPGATGSPRRSPTRQRMNGWSAR